MKSIILLILNLFVSVNLIQAQWITFQAEYSDEGYEQFESISQTADGGYITSGVAKHSGKLGISLIKYDDTGSVSWTNFLNVASPSLLNYARDLTKTTDGGYLLTGRLENDPFMLKTDNTGSMMWSKVFGDASAEDAYSVKETADGGFILVGQRDLGFGTGGTEIYVIKTSSTGTLIWSKTYGGANNEVAHSIINTSDGGYLIAGNTKSFVSGGAGDQDMYLLKIDSVGTLQWAESYGETTKNEDAWGVEEDVDGGFVVGGYTTSGAYLCLMKVNMNGVFQWAKTYGSTGQDYCYGMGKAHDGGYLVFGYTTGFGLSGSDRDAYVVKTDKDGNLDWSKTYYGTLGDLDFFYSFDKTTDGGYIFSGATGPPGVYNGFIVKTDSNGNVKGCSNWPSTVQQDINFNTTSGGLIANVSDSSTPALTTLVLPIFTRQEFLCPSCPDADFDMNNICIGADAIFIDLSSDSNLYDITKWHWNFGDGDTSEEQNPTHNYLTTDSFEVTLIVENNSIPICMDTITKTVVVFDPPTGGIGNDTFEIKNGEEIQLSASGGDSYSWSPLNGLSCTGCPNPFASPQNTTTYIITITDTISGCFDLDTITIIVIDEEDTTMNLVFDTLFVPNAFSPNGDNVNDLLSISLKFIKEMQMNIYDRAGTLLVELNESSLIWDGIYNGNLLPVGVYIYYIRYTSLDNQFHTAKGNITIL